MNKHIKIFETKLRNKDLNTWLILGFGLIFLALLIKILSPILLIIGIGISLTITLLKFKEGKK